MIMTIIRILLGLLFVFSGILKLTDLISFHDAIEAFKLIPFQFSFIINPLTVLIPAVEIVCGVALVLNFFRKAAGSTLFLLMVVFTTGVAVNVYRGETFDCNCFG
ncbi:unnamed protein product, partial [marine sediment metagenome]